jgi:phage virion morphogenesis protein
MTGFQIEVDDRRLSRQLGKLAKVLGDLSPEMELIGNEILERARQSFDDEADPWDKKWRPLAPSTVAARQRKAKKLGLTGTGGLQILRDTGALLASLNMTSDKDSVTIGSPLEYAAIHQFGGMAGRGRSVRIPKRSYFPVDIGGRLAPKMAERLMKILTGRFD